MRRIEDKRLRDYEIRQWYYLLRSEYLSEGMSEYQATQQAYEDIGIRYCLRETSIRKAKNAGLGVPEERGRLGVEMRDNLQHLKAVIQKLENAINRNK